MTIQKRLAKLEKKTFNPGECKCTPRTRLILPDDFPGAKDANTTGPDSGICDTCGGRWENVVIEIAWTDGKANS